jgi:hypothetical protein
VGAFWKFLRPHTIRGTILGASAVTAKALMETPLLIDWGLLPRAALGVLTLLCGNGYIVGINQIYDVDIDKVNKPFLPIAAGSASDGMHACMLACTDSYACVVRCASRRTPRPIRSPFRHVFTHACVHGRAARDPLRHARMRTCMCMHASISDRTAMAAPQSRRCRKKERKKDTALRGTPEAWGKGKALPGLHKE